MSDSTIAKIKDVIDGLEVLAAYAQVAGTGDEVTVENDVIYAGPTAPKESLDKEDTKRLEAAGWFYNDQNECWGRPLRYNF